MSLTIAPARPDSDEAVKLLKELDTYLQGHPYPEESRHAFSIEKLLQEQVAFFIAHSEGEASGCGGVKLFGDEYGEVKRMFVKPEYRCLGIGKAILNALADHARQHGVDLLRLETGIYQTEAIGLYEAWGFERRGPFGEYKNDPMTVFFEKKIA